MLGFAPWVFLCDVWIRVLMLVVSDGQYPAMVSLKGCSHIEGVYSA